MKKHCALWLTAFLYVSAAAPGAGAVAVAVAVAKTISSDDGKTWALQAEYHMKRRSPATLP